jgi:hypothetical protein
MLRAERWTSSLVTIPGYEARSWNVRTKRQFERCVRNELMLMDLASWWTAFTYWYQGLSKETLIWQLFFGRKTLVELMYVAVNSEKSSLMVFAIVYVRKPGHFGQRPPWWSFYLYLFISLKTGDFETLSQGSRFNSHGDVTALLRVSSTGLLTFGLHSLLAPLFRPTLRLTSSVVDLSSSPRSLT